MWGTEGQSYFVLDTYQQTIVSLHAGLLITTGVMPLFLQQSQKFLVHSLILVLRTAPCRTFAGVLLMRSRFSVVLSFIGWFLSWPDFGCFICATRTARVVSAPSWTVPFLFALTFRIMSFGFSCSSVFSVASFTPVPNISLGHMWHGIWPRNQWFRMHFFFLAPENLLFCYFNLTNAVQSPRLSETSCISLISKKWHWSVYIFEIHTPFIVSVFPLSDRQELLQYLIIWWTADWVGLMFLL